MFKILSEVLLPISVHKVAESWEEFIKVLSEINESSVYYHTCGYLLRDPEGFTDFVNDFSKWLSENNLKEASEKMNTINPFECRNLKELKEEVLRIAKSIKVEGKLTPFYFIECDREVIDTGICINTLQELKDAVREISYNGVFYNLLGVKLWEGKRINTFSEWLSEMKEERKAHLLEKLDVNSLGLQKTKKEIIKILNGEV